MLIRRRIWEDFADELIKKKKNNLNWLLHLPRGSLGLEGCFTSSQPGHRLLMMVTSTEWLPGQGACRRPPSTCPERISPSGRSAPYGTNKACGHTLRGQERQERKVNKRGLQTGHTTGSGGDWGWETHFFRHSLSLAPGNHRYVGMQPRLLSLQEQNSRFLYKISLFV